MFVSASWTIRYADRSTPAGSFTGVALDGQLDRQPRLAHLLDELGQRPEPRLRRERGDLVLLAHDPDEPPHLRQRLAPRLLDGHQCLPLAFLLGLEQAPDRARLHGHDADRVREDVVELAGDPDPLLGDRRLSFLLGAQRSRLGAPDLLGPVGGSSGEREDARKRQRDPERLRPLDVRGAQRHRPAAEDHGGERDPGLARFEQRAGRPRRQEQDEEHRARVVGRAGIEQRERDPAGCRHDRRDEGGAPAEKQRPRRQQRQRRGSGMGVVLVRPGLHLGEDDHRHDGHLEGVRARADQEVLGHEGTVLDTQCLHHRPV